jgi:hypothetical protein
MNPNERSIMTNTINGVELPEPDVNVTYRYYWPPNTGPVVDEVYGGKVQDRYELTYVTVVERPATVEDGEHYPAATEVTIMGYKLTKAGKRPARHEYARMVINPELEAAIKAMHEGRKACSKCGAPIEKHPGHVECDRVPTVTRVDS